MRLHLLKVFIASALMLVPVGHARGSTPIVVRDDVGREVGLETPASRVAALTAFSAEALEEFGLTPVAKTRFDADQESPAGVMLVSMDHASGPDLEQLVLVRPDLVVLDPSFARFAPAVEAKTGARVVCVGVRTPAEVVSKIDLLGRVTGRSESAKASAERWMERFESAAERLQQADAGRTLVLFGGGRSIFAFLPETYVGAIVTGLGGRMCTEGLPAHEVYRNLTPVTLEQVLALDPDRIVMITHRPSAASFSTLEGHPVWRHLRAVKAGRVHALSDDLFVLRAGADVPGALEEMSRVLGDG